MYVFLIKIVFLGLLEWYKKGFLPIFYRRHPKTLYYIFLRTWQYNILKAIKVDTESTDSLLVRLSFKKLEGAEERSEDVEKDITKETIICCDSLSELGVFCTE